MLLYLYVAIGGAIGSVGRFWTGQMAALMWGESFPWGTIIINVLGSFIIGAFATASLPDGALPSSIGMRAFVLVGLCGGYTTFSSFSLQTLQLLRAGELAAALANIALSVLLCLGSVALGHFLAVRAGMLRG